MPYDRVVIVIGILMAAVIWVGILSPIVIGIFGCIRWRGGWRVAAAAPLVVLVLFFAPLIRDWMRDPTAHNLWGLLFIPLSLVLCVYSGTLVVLHRRKRTPS